MTTILLYVIIGVPQAAPVSEVPPSNKHLTHDTSKLVPTLSEYRCVQFPGN